MGELDIFLFPTLKTGMDDLLKITGLITRLRVFFGFKLVCTHYCVRTEGRSE